MSASLRTVYDATPATFFGSARTNASSAWRRIAWSDPMARTITFWKRRSPAESSFHTETMLVDAQPTVAATAVRAMRTRFERHIVHSLLLRERAEAAWPRGIITGSRGPLP